MYDVAVCTDLYRHGRGKVYSDRALGCLLWALVFANEAYLVGSDDLVPPLYLSGVEWREEKPQGRTACPAGDGQELFLGIRQVRAQGHADCEDVVSWRCAELRLGRVSPSFRGPPPFPGHPEVTIIPPPWPMQAAGPDVWPGFFMRRTGAQQITIHIVVSWPDGFIEDPSRQLGMGGARKYG